MSSLALLQFFKNVPRVLLVFSDSKRSILEPGGAHGENFCISSSNLHPKPKRTSQKCSQKCSKTILWSLPGQLEWASESSNVKNPFFAPGTLWGIRGFEPRTWEMGPRLYIDILCMGLCCLSFCLFVCFFVCFDRI